MGYAVEFCQHCREPLVQQGSILVLCSCRGAYQAELLDRERGRRWRQQRAQNLEEQLKTRRESRRGGSTLKKGPPSSATTVDVDP